MAGRWRGDIGGSEQEGDGYNDILNLNWCYFIYIFVTDLGRSREVEARKEADRRRKKRMGTVPLSEFSRNRTP